MFIGGLNWDTTDGTYYLFTGYVFVALNKVNLRRTQGLLFAIWQSRRVYHHARRCRSFAMLCVLNF
jgi:hypothetical protein